MTHIKPKRILLLTQWFDPEPTLKGLIFARELVKFGFEVEVLTGFPNYPQGRLYPGYKLKFFQREIVDGVSIARVPLYPSHDLSAFKRILNYISFSFSSAVYGIFIAQRADVIYAYHPPLTVGVAAALIRFFRRIPVVYDIQDMWPDTLQATGMLNNPRVLSIVGFVCSFVYKFVDKIVVLSPGFKNLLVDRGVPEQKIDIIYNWANESDLKSPVGSLSNNFPTDDRFKLVFAGNMGKAQALDAVIDAAVILQDCESRVCFVMLGGGLDLDRLKERARSLNLKNLIFLPSVPMSEVSLTLAAADALLVHLRQDPLFKITIPSKTQAYMAVGKPLLMAVDGDASDLVIESKCGLTTKAGDPAALAETVQKFAELSTADLLAMGERARKFYTEQLSLQVGVRKFVDIFKSLIT